jgi:hypothetical protein
VFERDAASQAADWPSGLCSALASPTLLRVLRRS